jgi:Family of unknown function (DUF6178)
MNDKLAVPSRTLLSRILDEPQIVQAVQALPPPALLQLIDQVGLADAGEIVALATTGQLEKMFDEDLWRSAAPGADERFDPARFGLWLEVMLEAGEAFAADTLANLDEELLALALHAELVVIDLDELVLTAIEPELEKALESEPYLDFDQYRALGRRMEGWDTLGAALTALDQRHPGLLRRLLERLGRASGEWIADNGGLCQVLTSIEMLEEDAAAEREDRRARSGHVAPASARAFLTLPVADVHAVLSEPRDAITRAYFREYCAADQPVAERARSWVEEIAGAPRPLLEGGSPEPETLLKRTLALLGEDVAQERLRELAYLSNVLLTGATRRYRPLDAAHEALTICNAGLQRAVEATGRGATDVLAHTGCEKLFRLGRPLNLGHVGR